MKALNNQEISVEMANEVTLVDNTPKKSIFQFHIKETVEELLQNMKEKDGEYWDFIDNSSNWSYEQPIDYLLSDISFFSQAEISVRDISYIEKASRRKINGLEMIIKTAWSGFRYEIRSFINQPGAIVTFFGPLNALTRQWLLPRMSYVHHTLFAKYDDMQEYLEISDFCILREAKANGQKNEQDYYGGHINYTFNNEIPTLPAWVDYQKEEEEEFEIEIEEPEISCFPISELIVC